MMWTRRKTVVAASSGVVAAGLAAGLLLIPGQSHLPSAKPAENTFVPTPAPVPTRLLSPFTGEPVASLHPVLAVKIDNIVLARPQTGLTRAGPVRSAREDDLELLRQFGRPAFAYSGAQPQLLKVVERARIVDLYDGLVAGYYRDDNRIAPYNLYAHTRRLLAEAKAASEAHNIGFRFGPPLSAGRIRTSESVSYPAASFTFTWLHAKGRWLVWMDGRRAASTEGSQLSAATVVIQRTTVRTSRFLEWPGIRPPYAESTGSGPALVLRNGKAYHARWSRPHANGGTTFTTDSGQPMTFARGPVWVVLVQR
jgi:hypothetical protein